MLQSIKKSYGISLGASDGEIGHVKDYYFDDENWAIRYLVADTGSWLPARQVLISPHALRQFDSDGKILRVNLTRKQIEDSPSIESHKPVSRQYEEEYYQYFGWPYYWRGNELWGLSGFPILQLPTEFQADDAPTTNGSPTERTDAHLRSTQAVIGYQLRTGDGTIGHVSDFMMDTRSWRIEDLSVRTGHRLTGKDVFMPTLEVDRISFVESTVFLYSATKAVARDPAQHLFAKTTTAG